MMAQVLIPRDAVGTVVQWLTDLRSSGLYRELTGMTITGEALTPGETPVNTIRVSLVGSDPVERIGDRDSVRVQIWQSGSVKARIGTARLISGLARAKLAARIEAGPLSLPDPSSAGVTLSQLEFAITTIGESR